MFLGLDRRFFSPTSANDEANDRKREYLLRRYWNDDQALRIGNVHALAEVNYLVVNSLQEVRASQEQLDEKLREEFFARAFEYKPADIFGLPGGVPSREALEGYRRQLTRIEQVADSLKIPVPEIQTLLTHFFDRMNGVVKALERSSETASKKRNSKIKAPTLDKDFMEWIINKPQADRIFEHLKLLDDYIEKRTALRDPITRFLSLLNTFLKQTNKKVTVESKGQLEVSMPSSEIPRSIAALSSGERQLLVMLAHLSLNPSLAESGVFIVDEPELSLHMDWQEKFVDAVREANPKVQLILATHSPAIILDRIEACKSLSEVPND